MPVGDPHAVEPRELENTSFTFKCLIINFFAGFSGISRRCVFFIQYIRGSSTDERRAAVILAE